jgi:hypothetical protein
MGPCDISADRQVVSFLPTPNRIRVLLPCRFPQQNVKSEPSLIKISPRLMTLVPAGRSPESKSKYISGAPSTSGTGTDFIRRRSVAVGALSRCWPQTSLKIWPLRSGHVATRLPATTRSKSAQSFRPKVKFNCDNQRRPESSGVSAARRAITQSQLLDVVRGGFHQALLLRSLRLV